MSTYSNRETYLLVDTSRDFSLFSLDNTFKQKKNVQTVEYLRFEIRLPIADLVVGTCSLMEEINGHAFTRRAMNVKVLHNINAMVSERQPKVFPKLKIISNVVHQCWCKSAQRLQYYTEELPVFLIAFPQHYHRAPPPPPFQGIFLAAGTRPCHLAAPHPYLAMPHSYY